jgi:hypothetical protein
MSTSHRTLSAPTCPQEPWPFIPATGELYFILYAHSCFSSLLHHTTRFLPASSYHSVSPSVSCLKQLCSTARCSMKTYSRFPSLSISLKSLASLTEVLWKPHPSSPLSFFGLYFGVVSASVALRLSTVILGFQRQYELSSPLLTS